MTSRLVAPATGHPLLTVTEAAAALGSSPRTVQAYLRGGRFPGAFKTPGGGRWRIPVGDVWAARVELGIDDGSGS